MAALTGNFISQSYGGLIHLTTNTGIVSNKPLTGSSSVRPMPNVAPDEKSKEISSVAGKDINRL